ncbi:ATP-binding protein [Azospirillum sp. SYSU D00513]|uniref:ATP-binding protein n=1 Tax=Azospirillum sp. SYSU D00513 TaxID=2812561 RepID=UPI001A96A6DB|nr:ATP-binding protein [Azospirillum sp. SYSU D00513]
MPPKVTPPPRLMLALFLLVAPLGLALALLAAEGSLTPAGAVGGLVLALGGAGLILRIYLHDLRMVGGYVSRLTEEEEFVPPPDGGSDAARAVNGAVARLHRAFARRSERAVARSEANDSIVEALHDALLLVDAGRQVVRANQTARTLFGDRLLQRDLAASLRTPVVLEAVDAVLGGAASRTVEFSLPLPVERTFEARVTPFRPPLPVSAGFDPGDGGPAPAAMAILTLNDITALRRSEQMRADFIANASHELRTPLSSLLGFIETLRGPARDDTEAQERFLGIMQDQASRMSRLVNDLLSLSRIEQDEHMPPSDRVDVLDSLQGVLDALELKAAERRIRLTLEVPPGPPPMVTGDEDQLTQVFQNLVSNAIKYTREDTEVTVSVTLADPAARAPVPNSAPGTASGAREAARLSGRATGRPMVAVSVRDRGDGIARTHLPRLTERFYRVDAARSRAMGGTGLGLAIVKHIVNRHRGRLTIESEVGTGSTFTVQLPVAAEETQPAGARRQAGAL